MAAVMLFLCVPGCSSERTKAVMELDGVSIGADVYRYWLSTFKYYFVQNYEDIEDTVECWNKEMDDGLTIGEYVEKYTLQYAKNVLCALKLYKDYKLSLSKSVINNIDDTIDDMIKYQYGDSKSEFNNALMATYGMDLDGLRNAFIMEAKVDAVESYLFGENGTQVPTNAEVDAFYKENYSRLLMIVVNTSYELILDDKGNVTLDDKGEVAIKEYTEEEIAQKKAKAQEAFDKANAGEEFEKLVEKYNELTVEECPNGFYITNYEFETLVVGGYDSKALSEVLKMKEGDIYRYEDEESISIVKKVPLIEKAYSSKDDAEQLSDIQSHLITKKYNEILQQMWDDIVVEEYVSTLKTVDVKKGFI